MHPLNRITIVSILLFTIHAIAGPIPEEEILHAQVPEIPVVFDWNIQSTLTEAPVIFNTQAGLLKANPKTGALDPDLAISFSKSKDEKTYEFKINPKARWSDGRPVFAQDFIYAWNRAGQPQSTSIYSYYFDDILNLEAKDDSVLIVKLKQAVKDWEKRTVFWPFFPARKDLVEKMGNNAFRPGAMVSSGAFIIDGYEPGKQMTLIRNPYYPSKQNPSTSKRVEKIILHFSSDVSKNFEAYQAGKIHSMSPIPKFSDRKLDKEKIKVPLKRVYVFGINVQRFPFTNRKFRQAIFQGLERPQIPNSQIVDSLIPRPYSGSNTRLGFRFNPTRAKSLLAESAVALNPKLPLKILTSNQEPFLTLGRKIQESLAKNLAQNWEVLPAGGEEYTTLMNLGDYGAFITAWTAKVPTPADFLLPYSGLAVNNRAHYFDSEFDRLVLKGDFQRAQQKITSQDFVLLPLIEQPVEGLIRPKFSGVDYNYLGSPLFHYAQLK